MKTHIINNHNYIIPTSWLDVSIDKFLQLQEKQPDDELETLVNIINILTEIPVAELESLPLPELKAINKELQFLTTDIPNNQMAYDYTIAGNLYRMDKDLNNMSTREYIDLDTLLKDNHLSKLHYIMAVLYRPVIKDRHGKEVLIKYRTEDLEERASLFLKSLPVTAAVSTFLFFSLFVMTYYEHMQGYSKIQTAGQTKTTDLNQKK